VIGEKNPPRNSIWVGRYDNEICEYNKSTYTKIEGKYYHGLLFRVNWALLASSRYDNEICEYNKSTYTKIEGKYYHGLLFRVNWALLACSHEEEAVKHFKMAQWNLWIW